MSEAIRDRRQAARVESLGQAFVIIDGDTAVPYRVENLSSGGALLCDGPPLPWCATLQVVLRVEPLPPLEVDARIIWRAEGKTPRYGIEFVCLDTSAADAINDAVGAILAGDRATTTRASLASWLP